MCPLLFPVCLMLLHWVTPFLAEEVELCESLQTLNILPWPLWFAEEVCNFHLLSLKVLGPLYSVAQLHVTPTHGDFLRQLQPIINCCRPQVEEGKANGPIKGTLSYLPSFPLTFQRMVWMQRWRLNKSMIHSYWGLTEVIHVWGASNVVISMKAFIYTQSIHHHTAQVHF